MSALLSVEFGYGKIIKDLTDDQYIQLQKAMPDIFKEPKDEW